MKSMLHRAYEGDFSEEDQGHTLGGVRYLGWIGDDLIAIGSTCSRTIWLNDVETHVGYFEAAAKPKCESCPYLTNVHGGLLDSASPHRDILLCQSNLDTV